MNKLAFKNSLRVSLFFCFFCFSLVLIHATESDEGYSNSNGYLFAFTDQPQKLDWTTDPSEEDLYNLEIDNSLIEDQAETPVFDSIVLKYIQSPSVEDDVWEKVKPYLFPEDHPLKQVLDRIFSSTRVTATVDTLRDAGFVFTERQGLHVITTRHPDLPGLIIKLYTDFQYVENDWQYVEKDWEHWLKRITGANILRKAIPRLGYSDMFKVPKKWIYPLPYEPSPPDSPGYYRKNFILIAKDMDIVSVVKNRKKWREDIKRSHLKALYILIKKYGLDDSIRPNNVPWSRDGKLAFVDTEVHHRFPVNFHPMLEYLNTDNRKYWRELTGLE